MGPTSHPRQALLARIERACVRAIAASAILMAACGRTSVPGSGPLRVVAKFGEVGVSPGQFSYPRAMDRDGSSLWIIDKMARVQHLDAASGTYLGGWKMPESKFGKPTGVTAAPGDGGETLVYVPDTHYHRVMVYRPGDAREGQSEPTLVAEIGSFGELPGQFIYPTDVAVLVEPGARNPSRIYVSEYGGNDRINVFEHGTEPNSYTYSFSFGTFGESDSADNIQFKRPQSMAIDMKRRELIITDACNHRIGRFTLDGKLLAWIGTGSGEMSTPAPDPTGGGANATGSPALAAGVAGRPPRFQYPYGLSLRDDGTALVCEFGADRVQWIDVERGVSLGVFGVPGRAPGQLASPWAVAAIGERVYVLDSANNRVQAFDLPLRSGHVAMSVPPGKEERR